MVVIHGCPSTVSDEEGNDYYVGFFGLAGCWMTQNLRTTTGLIEGEDYMYPGGSKQEYYEEDHGLLYKWHAAENACPAGWHLPNSYAYFALIATVNGAPTGVVDTGGTMVGERLTLTDGRSWTTLTGYSRRANDGGMAMLPVGYFRGGETIMDSWGFWKAAYNPPRIDYFIKTEDGFGMLLYENYEDKGDAYSVRCVMDQE
jgi:uncharacterized protein (TIGR02145 family)